MSTHFWTDKRIPAPQLMELVLNFTRNNVGVDNAALLSSPFLQPDEGHQNG